MGASIKQVRVNVDVSKPRVETNMMHQVWLHEIGLKVSSFGQIIEGRVDGIAVAADRSIQIIDHLRIGLAKEDHTRQAARRCWIDSVQRRMQRTPGPRHIRVIQQEKYQRDENEIEREKDRIELNEYHTVDQFSVMVKGDEESVVPA